MQSKSDAQLLREYAKNGSNAAFSEIVERQADLVYSAALRQVGSPDLARDVAQNVFSDLARKACSVSASLSDQSSIVGWLYRATRFEALNLRREESRRLARERHAMEQMFSTPEAALDWDQLHPLLDESMAELGEADREALLLRFFKNHDLRQVGVALGVSDDAAQKRVSRALEKLRENLSRRGLKTAVGGLAIVISANAVHAAPAGLIATISTTTIAATTVAATAKAIAMTTLQKVFVVTVLTAAVGASVYQTRRSSTLQTQMETIQQQQAPLTAKVNQLQQERDVATARQATLEAENDRLRQAAADVPKLRNEVTRSRTAQAQTKVSGTDTNDPAIQNFLAFKAKAMQISGYFDQMPDKKIPELHFLADEDWLIAVKAAKFDTDEDIRKTLSKLRSLAKSKMPMGSALSSYLHEHDGQLPKNLSELKPYFKTPPDGGSASYWSGVDPERDSAVLDSILARYTLLHTGNVKDLKPNAWLIAETAPVDKEYDSRLKFGNGTSALISTGLNEAGDPDDKSY